MLKPCCLLYSKVSPLPLSFIDNAKVRNYFGICKFFMLKEINGWKILCFSSTHHMVVLNPIINSLQVIYHYL